MLLYFVLYFAFLGLQRTFQRSTKCFLKIVSEVCYVFYKIFFFAITGTILLNVVIMCIPYLHVDKPSELIDQSSVIIGFFIQFCIMSHFSLRYNLGISAFFLGPATMYIYAIVSAIKMSTLVSPSYAGFPLFLVEVLCSTIWGMYLYWNIEHGKVKKEKIEKTKSVSTALTAIGTMALLSSTLFNTIGWGPPINEAYNLNIIIPLMILYPFHIAILVCTALLDVDMLNWAKKHVALVERFKEIIINRVGHKP